MRVAVIGATGNAGRRIVRLLLDDPSAEVIACSRSEARLRHGAGSESCIPMCIEEIRELADSGVVESTGFFMAGFGPIMDYGVLPVAMGLAKVNRRWASSFLWWGLRHYGSSPEQGDLLLEAEPWSDGELVRIRVSHPDPYVLTAVPAVAAIHQMLANPRPGVWTQAGFVEPASFFEQIGRMGLVVEA